MIKKLKITESQYQRLLASINETPFDKMIKSNVKVGDVIAITWKGSMNKFKVVDNIGGQIIMDNIDEGSTNSDFRYFLVFTSLNGDDLQLRRVHKTNEKDKLDGDKSAWAPYTARDVTNIQIIRDGKVIDTVDPVSPSAEKQQKKGVKPNAEVDEKLAKKIDDDLAIIMDSISENKGLKLMFNQGELVFCCINKTNYTFTFEINQTTNKILPDLNSWDTFILELKGDPNDENQSLYALNKDVVSTIDNGETFNLLFNVISGEKKQKINIKGIKGVSPMSSCESDEEDGEKDLKDKTPEELKYDAEKVYQMVLNDPSMKAAFYKQPTFWQAFVAELMGKKPPSPTGIVPVLDIVSKYTSRKVNEKIGEGFQFKGEVLYRPITPIQINYKAKQGNIETYSIGTDRTYKIDIRRFEINQVGKVLMTNFDNPDNYKLRILVKEKTENPNVKICDVEIVQKKSNDNFIVKSIGDEGKNVKIEFLKSEGYIPQKEEEKK